MQPYSSCVGSLTATTAHCRYSRSLPLYYKNGHEQESVSNTVMKEQALADMARAKDLHACFAAHTSASSPKPYTRSSNLLPIDYTFLGTTVP
jgi:hypothetical protein